MKIFLEEWLARIPDFSLDPDNPPIRVTGIVHSHETLHLIWPQPVIDMSATRTPPASGRD